MAGFLLFRDRTLHRTAFDYSAKGLTLRASAETLNTEQKSSCSYLFNLNLGLYIRSLNWCPPPALCLRHCIISICAITRPYLFSPSFELIRKHGLRNNAINVFILRLIKTHSQKPIKTLNNNQLKRTPPHNSLPLLKINQKCGRHSPCDFLINTVRCRC